jgi:cyanophycinase
VARFAGVTELVSVLVTVSPPRVISVGHVTTIASDSHWPARNPMESQDVAAKSVASENRPISNLFRRIDIHSSGFVGRAVQRLAPVVAFRFTGTVSKLLRLKPIPTALMMFPVRSRTIHTLVVSILGLCVVAATQFDTGAVQLSTAQPGRLVIIGGALSASNESVYRAILDARLEKGPFCVFPTAGATPETGMAGPVATFDRYGGPGTAKGILVSMTKPETARDPAVVEQIRGCSGFFFIGGVQSRVIAAFRPDGKSTPAYEALMQRWREGAVVSGSSAGAAIMSDPMIAGGTSAAAITRGVRRIALTPGADDDTTGGVSISLGLGFFPAALADQHFLARGRFGRLLVATLELDQFDLAFGIDENTALVVDGKTVWAAGASGIVVIDERGARRTGRSATGVAIHLMGSGDRFDLDSRRLTQDTGKSALRAAPPDSTTVSAPADVFARWEFLHLLHRFGRSPQKDVAVQIPGGQMLLRKDPAFRAVTGQGSGVQNTPAGLGLSGLTLDLSR